MRRSPCAKRSQDADDHLQEGGRMTDPVVSNPRRKG